MRVAGTISLESTLTAALDEAFAGTVNLPAALKASFGIVNGTAANQATKVVPFTLILAASTPQTLDLSAMLWPDGIIPVSFTAIRGILAVNTTATAGAVTKLGPAASNGWFGPLGGTTPTLDCRAGSPLLLCNLLGSEWAVDSTHKALKFDPGTVAQVINGILIGV